MKKKVFRIVLIPVSMVLMFFAFSSFVDDGEGGGGSSDACDLYCKSLPNYQCIITWGDGTKTTCDQMGKK